MKKLAIIAVMLLTTGLCLAQSDSAKPAADSVKMKVQVQQTSNDSTTVTVTTEPGRTDSTTTVTIHSDQKQDIRPHWRRNWVLGMRAGSWSALPGSLFLQKIVRNNVFVGCGFEYMRNPSTSSMNIPNVNYGNYDNFYHNGENRNSYSSWSIDVSPECVVPIVSIGKYRMLSGLSGDYKYYLVRGSNYNSDFNSTDTTYRFVDGKARCSVYSLSLPVIIERGFRVRKQTFFVGLQSTLISLDYSRQLVEWDETYRPSSGPVVTNSTGYYIAYPLRLNIRNPFQGDVRLLIKWYI